MQKKLFVAE